MSADRAVSPVIGTVVMVGVVVLLAAVVSVSFLGIVTEAKDTNERPIPVSDNLLSNGDFETGTPESWINGSLERPDPRIITTDDPSQGNYALRMDGTDDYVAQNVTKPIKSGRIYRLCADSKTTTQDTDVYIGVQYYDSESFNEDTTIEKAFYTVDSTSYREQCVLTELPDRDVVGAQVWIYDGDTGSSGTVFVDDISLVEVRYLADPDRDTDNEPA
ncbi:type IV pilin [Halohasta salina]|uniref:type IV pilin n=1 Tax=Halohasta salina TaxID=2961621 RepID=UPI0020A27590|nr:type IV pilin [Halohasta salina]